MEVSITISNQTEGQQKKNIKDLSWATIYETDK